MKNKSSSSQVRAPNYSGSNGREPISDEDLIRGFLLDLAASGRAEKTLTGYEGSIRALSDFGRREVIPPLASMERDHLRFWMGSLWKAGNKPATVHTRYRAVKRFFEWCVNEGERADNPIASIDPPRLPEVIQPDYQPEDVEKLLKAAARDKTVHSLRDAAVLLVLFDTGVRSGELIGMRVSDLDWKELSIRVTGKASKQRHVAFGHRTAQAIERYLRRRGADTDILWLASGGTSLSLNGLRMMLQRRFQDSGLEFRGAHAFRRGFAIQFLEAGGEPSDLKALAGWESYAMLARYTKRTESERAIRAHKKFSPADRLGGREV